MGQGLKGRMHPGGGGGAAGPSMHHQPGLAPMLCILEHPGHCHSRYMSSAAAQHSKHHPGAPLHCCCIAAGCALLLSAVESSPHLQAEWEAQQGRRHAVSNVTMGHSPQQPADRAQLPAFVGAQLHFDGCQPSGRQSLSLL